MPTENVAEKDERTSTQAPRFLPLATISVRLEGTSLSPRSPRDPVFGILSNMSLTGACVITNHALTVDTTVELTIENRAAPVKLPARIVWSAERMEPVKEIVGFLTGVRFEAESKETIEKLLSSGIFQLVP